MDTCHHFKVQLLNMQLQVTERSFLQHTSVSIRANVTLRWLSRDSNNISHSSKKSTALCILASRNKKRNISCWTKHLIWNTHRLKVFALQMTKTSKSSMDGDTKIHIWDCISCAHVHGKNTQMTSVVHIDQCGSERSTTLVTSLSVRADTVTSNTFFPRWLATALAVMVLPVPEGP